MQNPDPKPAKAMPLQMPTPERLGLSTAKTNDAVALDWNAVWSQLRRMKAVGFRLANLNDGQVRVTFILPGGEPDRHFHVEATGPNEAHAVHAALARADAWVRSDR